MLKVPVQQWRPCVAQSAQVHGPQLRPEQKTQIITWRTYKTNNKAETTENTHKTCIDSARASSSTRLLFARTSYKHVQYGHKRRFCNNSLKQSDMNINRYVHARQYLRQNSWRRVATRGLALLRLQTRIWQMLPVTKRSRSCTQKHKQQHKKTYRTRRARFIHAGLPNVVELRTSNRSVLITETGLESGL